MESTLKPPKTSSVSKVALRPRRKRAAIAAVRRPAPHPALPREPYVEPTDRSTLLAFYFYMGTVAIAVIYFLLLPFFV